MGREERQMTHPVPLVLVVDDDLSVRVALDRLLKSHGFGVEVFASGEELLGRPLPDVPACVLLDVRMPGLSGLELQRILAERKPDLPLVFLTGHGDIPITVRAMKAGAVDFLAKPCNDQDLLAAIREALARQARAREANAELAAIRQRAASLSPREREVMALVVRGLLNKQVGQQLGVTEKTVKAHRAQVMRKMQAASLAELVRLAERAGVSSSPQKGPETHGPNGERRAASWLPFP
jgi:RNA polymerase sigma factor (sigma-70 family)